MRGAGQAFPQVVDNSPHQPSIADMKFFSALILFLVGFSANAKAGEMLFTSIPSNSTTFVYAHGEITIDTPQRLEAHLKSIEEGSPHIIFNSQGGSLFAGIRMGEIIRKNGVSTSVGEWQFKNMGHYIDKKESGPGNCFSACALAFMGGVERSLDNRYSAQRTLGFHQFYGSLQIKGVELLSSAQITSALIAEYLRSMGAHPSLFETMSRTPPSQMFVPNAQQISMMNILTPTSFRNFELVPRNGRIVARAVHLQNAIHFQRVAIIEAACLNGQSAFLLYTTQGRGLSSEFVQEAPSNSYLNVSLSAGGQTVEQGPESVKLYANTSLVATIVLDRSVAQGFSKGEGRIRFNIPTASGVLLSASTGSPGAEEPALEALFNNCK